MVAQKAIMVNRKATPVPCSGISVMNSSDWPFASLGSSKRYIVDARVSRKMWSGTLAILPAAASLMRVQKSSIVV